METASPSACLLKGNCHFSKVFETNNIFLSHKTGDRQWSRHAMMLKQELMLGLR